MTDKELNEKLAKWAGMKKVDPCQWKIEGHTQYYTPYFTISLDACFKWLVPKLEPLGYDLEISNDAEMKHWRVVLHKRDSECSIASPYIDYTKPDEPARALAEAIGQMIDNEEGR